MLDVIDVPVLDAQPSSFQTENWLLDPKYYWSKIRSVTRNDLADFIDPATPLWVNGYGTYNGLNDRIPLEEANYLDSSLRLIKVDRLELVVAQPHRAFSDYRRRVQGRFTYSGEDYWLRVTDPVYERRYLSQPDGNYEIGESYLTVSLGESYQGYSYKLIAAVIEC